MSQLFKEVTNPKDVDKEEAGKQQNGAAQESSKAQLGATESTPKKAKHGEDGVCCGGCS